MVGTNPDETISRRSVLKRIGGAFAVGGGLAAGGSGPAVGGEVTARRAAVHEGVTCGDGHPEGSTFTVENRCDGGDGCDVIRLDGLSPGCVADEKRLYADLPGTEPTVWMSPRNGEIPPDTYRVIRAERCERGAGECDGAALYRLAFRPTEG